MFNFEIPIFGHLFLSIFDFSKKLYPKKNSVFWNIEFMDNFLTLFLEFSFIIVDKSHIYITKLGVKFIFNIFCFYVFWFYVFWFYVFWFYVFCFYVFWFYVFCFYMFCFYMFCFYVFCFFYYHQLGM